MEYSNELVKAYILSSFAGAMANNSYLRPWSESHTKIDVYLSEHNKYVEIDAYCREEQFNDESKWVRHYSHKFTAGQILQLFDNNRYEHSGNRKPLEEYGYNLWKEIQKSEQEFFDKKKEG